MYIIKIEATDNGLHHIESQSHREECWLDGYIEVPTKLESKVMGSKGYCNLVIENNVLVDIIPTEIPKKQDVEESIALDERVTALESALLELVMGGTE